MDRAQLLAAISETKAQSEEAQAKARDLTWSEAQLLKAHEQLELARQRETQLKAVINSMVPKSELDAAKAHLNKVEITASEETDKLRATALLLKSCLSKLEAEKGALEITMQVFVIST